MVGVAREIVSFTADKTSPQPVGTIVTFTAIAEGGHAPYQYKWYLFDGTAWSVVADWSGASSYAWTPNAANPNYRVGVWVRSVGDTGDEAETAAALASMGFVIQ